MKIVRTVGQAFDVCQKPPPPSGSSSKKASSSGGSNGGNNGTGDASAASDVPSTSTAPYHAQSLIDLLGSQSGCGGGDSRLLTPAPSATSLMLTPPSPSAGGKGAPSADWPADTAGFRAVSLQFKKMEQIECQRHIFFKTAAFFQ